MITGPSLRVNLALVDLIFRKEILEAFRDRKTIVFMILMPVILYPLLGIGFFQLALIQVSRMGEQAVTVAFGEVAPPERFLELLQEDGKVEVAAPESPLDEAMRTKKIQAVIEFPADYEKTLRGGGQIEVKIRYDDADELSSTTYNRIWNALGDYEQEILDQRLDDQSLSKEFLHPIARKTERTATPERRAGYHFGRFLPYIILLMIINGTMYPAIDITAGEKERGTLECLLASPPTPLEVVLAKFGTVFFFGVISTVLNLASLGLTVASIFHSFRNHVVAEMFVLSVSWETMAMTAVLLVPFTVLFSALLVAIASYADSFKEAQIYIMPLFFVVVLPAMVSALPGTELNGFWMIVPIANLCLLMKELFLEQATLEQTAVVFICSCAYAGVAISFAVRFFSQEEVLFPQEQSFALFRGQLWKGKRKLANLSEPKLGASDALMLYAIVFPLSYFVSTLALGAKPGLVILVQQWGVLFGISLLLATVARVKVHETFLLRLPRLTSLVATLLVLAGGMVLVRKYAFFQEQWLPAPKMIEEGFVKIFKDASGGSLAVLLFLGAFSPAVCEEVLFRGFILNGLRSRLSKWQCLMLNAVLFGALHMLVYQFVPTAALGLLLAWIAWETGSLLPCVLFHFLNNALALSFMHFTNYGESGDKLEAAGGWQAVLARLQGGAYPWWWAAAAAAMMVAGCWMMVKNGRMGKEGVMK